MQGLQEFGANQLHCEELPLFDDLKQRVEPGLDVTARKVIVEHTDRRVHPSEGLDRDLG
jgi:hypothetical protein